MQLITLYFYPNIIVVQTDHDISSSLRNYSVYSRTVKLYKGIDNVIRIQFKNRDQKTVNITGFIVKFSIINEVGETVFITKQATIVDGPKGIASVVLDDTDLRNLKSEFYHYAVSLVYPDGSEQAVYAGDNFDVRGEVQVLSGNYPSLRDSIDAGISMVQSETHGPVFTSSVISDAPGRQHSANHTAQFFFNDFLGTIEVQGSLDTIPAVGNSQAANMNWASIATLQYTNQSATTYENWQGVFTAFRFIITTVSGKVTKVLIRS